MNEQRKEKDWFILMVFCLSLYFLVYCFSTLIDNRFKEEMTPVMNVIEY